MIGVVVAFLLSWLVLWLISREHMTVLGILPTIPRLKELLVGVLFMASIGLLNFLWQAHFKEISYQANPDFGLIQMFNGMFWTLKAVVFEELAFRGVILFLLIRYIGVVKACLLDALIFGVYHWFSYEMFGGRIVPMIYILLVTGAGGWMFAYAFAKTKSLYASTGLHFGWNFMAGVVFSAGPLGDQWWLAQGEAVQWGGWVTLLFFSLQAIVAPGIVTFYLKRFYTPKLADD